MISLAPTGQRKLMSEQQRLKGDGGHLIGLKNYDYKDLLSKIGIEPVYL